MNDAIIFASIFFTTTVVVCIIYDCILRARMRRRMRETIEFVKSMHVIISNPEIPERVPF